MAQQNSGTKTAAGRLLLNIELGIDMAPRSVGMPEGIKCRKANGETERSGMVNSLPLAMIDRSSRSPTFGMASLAGAYTSWFGSGGGKKCVKEYREGLLHGEVVRWYENGLIRQQSTWKDDKLEGTAVTYHKNGRRRCRFLYDTGRLSGTGTFWDRQGQLIARCDFRDGKPWNGTVIVRWENGNRKRMADYSDGMLNGKNVRWYENGKKRVEYAYQTGKRHGPYASWNKQGELVAAGEYKVGRRWNGRFQVHYPNGEVKEELNCRAGKLHGVKQFWYDNGRKWLEYDFSMAQKTRMAAWDRHGNLMGIGHLRDGNLWEGRFTYWDFVEQTCRFEENYHKGKRNGREIEWYGDKEDQKKSSRFYVDGELHGPLTEWFRNGVRATSAEFRHGQRHGQWVGWHPNRKKRKEHLYVKGISTGKASYWDNRGKLLGQCEWKDNRQWNGLFFDWHDQTSRAKGSA